MVETTERIYKLNRLHDRALEAAESLGFNCTLMLCPGTGKTFASFKILYRMLELGLIEKGALVIYNAEVRSREKVLFNEDTENPGEIHKFKAIYGKDILSDFDFRFYCYQSKPHTIHNNFKDAGLVINDEAHDMLSAARYPILTKSKCRYNLCLTGAMSLDAHVFSVDEALKNHVQSDVDTAKNLITPLVTKGQVLSMFCPIAIKYTTSQAIEDGVIAEFRTYKIEHTLDDKRQNILIWKKNKRYGTEQQFWDQKYNYAGGPNSWQNPPIANKAILLFGLPNFLYSLPSKDIVVKAILKRLEGEKIVVFGERISTLQKILGKDNVVTPANEKELTDKFNSGEVKVIGSSKIIAQGSNLNGVQSIIFHSYVGKWDKVHQRRARIRWLGGEQAKLFFLVTKDTFEEDRIFMRTVTKTNPDGTKTTEQVPKLVKGWFSLMREERDEKKKLIRVHDMNVVSRISSATLVNWYKNQQK